jgi:two-component system LytT family response regulator
MSRSFNTIRITILRICSMPWGRILVRSDRSLFLLNREEIEWIEAKGQNTLLHCGKNHYSIRAGIQKIERELDPNQFVRIHRSYIVNLDSIRELKPRINRGYDVVLQDGTELTWSRHYSNRFHCIEDTAVTIPPKSQYRSIQSAS